MISVLNSYYLNLFLLLVVIIAINFAYHSKCNYSDLVTKMNELSLSEIGE
jgi:hypothetical protein